jgi:low temperature requirement protein LtrA
LLGTFLAITLTISMWWLYFDVTAIAAEHLLGHLHGVKRASMASDAYTYMHWLLIAGIMISALGVREVISVASDASPLGLFGACALFGGTALYQAGHALFWRRIAGQWKWWRLLAGALELALIPVGAMSHSLVALAIVVTITATVAFTETKKEDIHRASIRALRAD